MPVGGQDKNETPPLSCMNADKNMNIIKVIEFAKHPHAGQQSDAALALL